MILKTLLTYAICFIFFGRILDSDCSPLTDSRSRLDGLVKNSSLKQSNEADKKAEENVTTISDSSSIIDKLENKRGFPESQKLVKNAEKLDIENDYEIFQALLPEVHECILSRSEFYLSWWVNEDGKLKLPPSNRGGSSPGFADLSLKFGNSGEIFKHVSELTTSNPNDVRLYQPNRT